MMKMMFKQFAVLAVALMVVLSIALPVSASDDPDVEEPGEIQELPDATADMNGVNQPDGAQDEDSDDAYPDSDQSEDDGQDQDKPSNSSHAKIAGINLDRFGNDPQSVMAAAASMADGSTIRGLSNLNVSPGDEIRIYLDADMFIDEDGNPIGSEKEGISQAEIRNGRVSFSVHKQKNASVIEEMAIKYDSRRGTSYIKFEMVDPFSGVKKRAYNGTIRLRVDGKSYEETEFEVQFTVQNDKIELYGDEDYVDLSGSVYASPEKDIWNITVDIGHGVSVITNLFHNNNYYGHVNINDGAAADNATVMVTYQLSVTNLGGTTNSIVRFDLADDIYYAYDAKGNYLGTSKDDLAFSRTYHFTREHVEQLELKGLSDDDETSENGSGGGGGRGGRGRSSH